MGHPFPDLRKGTVRALVALTAATAPAAPVASLSTSSVPDPADRSSAGSTLRAPVADDTLDVFRFEEVAEGVVAALVLSDPDAYAGANSLFVIGEEGVLVVDTQQSQTAARALVDGIRERTELPVRWVVNTHWHGDHVNGNQIFREAFPDVNFIAHELTRNALRDEWPAALDDELFELPRALAERRESLATGRTPSGRTLTAAQRAEAARSVEVWQTYLEDLRTLDVVLPDEALSDGLTLDLGGRRADVIHAGPAHTPGDVVVLLPEERIAAAGDLVPDGPPWLPGTDVPGWASALEKLEAADLRTLVPGHGGVLRDGGVIRLHAAFLREVVVAAEDAHHHGWSEEILVAQLDREPFERFRPAFERWGLAGAAFDEYVSDAVREAFRDVVAAPGHTRTPTSPRP